MGKRLQPAWFRNLYGGLQLRETTAAYGGLRRRLRGLWHHHHHHRHHHLACNRRSHFHERPHPVDFVLNDRQLPDQCWLKRHYIQLCRAKFGKVGLICSSNPLLKRPHGPECSAVVHGWISTCDVASCGQKSLQWRTCVYVRVCEWLINGHVAIGNKFVKLAAHTNYITTVVTSDWLRSGCTIHT